MKKLSSELLAKTVLESRKAKKITQSDLSENTGINRSLLSRLETQDFTPSIEQLLALSDILDFDIASLVIDDDADADAVVKDYQDIPRMKITIAGAGSAGLSLAILFAQNHDVTVITTSEAEADKLNDFYSPIRDKEIERFFEEARIGERELSLHATTDKALAYNDTDLVIIATPTDCDEEGRAFDTSTVDNAIELALAVARDVKIVISSAVPVGYTDRAREKHGTDNIFFCPVFIRESMALYDDLHPSRIVVGANDDQKEVAQKFADLMLEGIRAEERRAEQKPQDIPILFVRPAEAETIKLFYNTYLAVRASFFNDLDTYAQIKGFDTQKIISGICMDPRIGLYDNNPSFGFSDYCLPGEEEQPPADFKDVPQNMIGAVVKSNSARVEFIADQIVAKSPAVVGVYRLTTKGNPNVLRGSAVKGVIKRIKENGIPVILYEPKLETHSELFECKVINDLEWFKAQSDVILADRFDRDDLGDVEAKVYTRDLYRED